MLEKELSAFARVVLHMREAVDWESETDLIAKSMTVAKAVAQLAALRKEQERYKNPRWMLARRRGLEKLVEAVVPITALEWGSWLTNVSRPVPDPILLISGVPVPVVAPLGPPRCSSKKELKGQSAFIESLEARRRAVEA
jgi:hypothetical protein